MKLTWPHVVVIGLVLAAVVTLAALGQDTSALVGLGTLLLAGIGLIAGQQQGIREQTNGNTSELLRMVRDLANKVADMTPAIGGHSGHTIDGTVVDPVIRTAEEEPPVQTPT